jgi:hypothetical protein
MSEPLVISEMYAFVTAEPGEDEGVIAVKVGGTFMPLVGADLARVDSMRAMAQSVVNNSGIKVKLLRFRVREELEILLPASST